MTASTWLRSGAPPWLADFADNPEIALDRLFRGGAYLGSLNAVDPDQILLNWTRALGPEFVEELDQALFGLITRYWNGRDKDLNFADLVWHRALRCVALLEPMPQRTTSLLWSVRDEAQFRLAPLVRNSARDALGWILL
jgi:hypothetical protein